MSARFVSYKGKAQLTTSPQFANSLSSTFGTGSNQSGVVSSYLCGRNSLTLPRVSISFPIWRKAGVNSIP